MTVYNENDAVSRRGRLVLISSKPAQRINLLEKGSKHKDARANSGNDMQGGSTADQGGSAETGVCRNRVVVVESPFVEDVTRDK